MGQNKAVAKGWFQWPRNTEGVITVGNEQGHGETPRRDEYRGLNHAMSHRAPPQRRFHCAGGAQGCQSNGNRLGNGERSERSNGSWAQLREPLRFGNSPTPPATARVPGDGGIASRNANRSPLGEWPRRPPQARVLTHFFHGGQAVSDFRAGIWVTMRSAI